MTETTLRVEFPAKLEPLFDPRFDAYVLYGGRDGCKSWGVARALLELGTQKIERILCGRETQNSITESVHQLLSDQIVNLGMQHLYRVQNKTIIGTGAAYGTEFFFAGVKHNVDEIKSFERITKVWMEEAGNVSRNSWEVVLPTIRTEGSKLYITFNPKLATDETYKRWVLNPPPLTWVQRIGWEDNIWLSSLSRRRIEHLFATDPERANHIYGGECINAVEGAIFGAEMKAALAEGRIGQVPYNKARPVDTAWDLGFGDLTTIWFLQAYDGWYNFIDYEQDSGITIADYIIRLQNRSYAYGTHWLPHDSVNAILHSRLAGSTDKTMSIEMLLRQAYPNQVRVAPMLYVSDRINAGRTIFPQCRFDAIKCADGTQALQHYAWESQEDWEKRTIDASKVHGYRDVARKRDPLHNWASHGADGFQAAAVAIKQPKLEQPKPPPPRAQPRFPDKYTPFG